MRVGSLFSGIGGLDLGLEAAGCSTEWFVENDPHCQAVLRRHWPDTPIYGDIHDLTGDELEPVDMIAGGYPCQPFSVAGNRQGEADARHLWPEMRRLVRVLRPRHVLLENVPGHLVLGLDRVLCDLAEDGYDAEWGVVSAQEMGAPHLRKRLFVVAHRESDRRDEGRPEPTRAKGRPNAAECRAADELADSDSELLHRTGDRRQGGRAEPPVSRPLADCDGGGRERCRPESAHAHVRSNDQADDEVDDTLCRRHEPQDDPVQAGRDCDINASRGQTQPTLGRDPHGLPCGLDPHRWPAPPGEPQHEWEPPRTVQDKVTNRVAQLKGLGNAVVPQVAEWIGRRIP